MESRKQEVSDMCTNFDFLKKNKLFSSFSENAIEAEKGLGVSAATAAILSRRALELAVRWVFVYDDSLKLPYRDNLSSLIHEDTFLDVLEPRLFPLLKYIVKLGNTAVHSNQRIKRDAAVLSLRNLFEFCKWMEYCYADDYEESSYQESLLEKGKEKKEKPEELQRLYEELSSRDKRLEDLRRENEALRDEMTGLRKEHVSSREFSVDAYTEAETRKNYINIVLMDAGWQIGRDCLEEVPVSGMPSPSGKGAADYVLFGATHLPLAVIESKRAGVNPAAGRQQAKLYADCLENQYGQRPLIFLTNGFEFYFIDDYNDYPERKVSGIFTKEELQIYIDRRKIRKSLEYVEIRDKITNRPYQKEAVMAVCDAIRKKRRKMLLVQATGSGKTRVSISIVDVLTRHNYVKNVLFLADRKALVRQAKKNYGYLLPNLTLCNLLDSKDDPEQSRMIFSTYPTMLNAIDETKRKDGNRLFTPAHFDLIIVDESHRSIYKKYLDIFEYFDAMLLGMTATPKDEIDKNTYSIFDLERRVPTYAYELKQAVKEHYLVSHRTLEYKTKIMEDGIHYDQLTEEEKEEFEETFQDEEKVEKDVSSTAVNEWLFNADTIDMVLKILMEQGLKVEDGDKLGKTIIFAKNSPHAKEIVNRFHILFPEYGESFIQQIDYSINYAETLIDSFSIREKMPQIAVSVDMLDTGIDIPEILNLVFFKKVRSYSKFWQMIGRGTRLCPDLLGPGMDKEEFLIFDFCNNFSFFREEAKPLEGKIGQSLAEKIFCCKVQIVRELQEAVYQSEEEYVAYRAELVNGLHYVITKLKEDSFRVKQRMRYVESYRRKEAWQHLGAVEAAELKEQIAPLMVPKKEDELTRRFDYLMYSIELAHLQHKNAPQNMGLVVSAAEQLSKRYTIPQVKEQREIIERVLEKDFWEQAVLADVEQVRTALRELMQFIEKSERHLYYTNFSDSVVDAREGEAVYASDDLKNYRDKVEYYLKEHQNSLAVHKLRNNKKLTAVEFSELERILWEELGTRKEYEREYGETPVGRLVRKIVGIDREAVNEAFGEFLRDERLNLNQMRFLRLIMDYISVNGNIEDNSVLMEEPFRSVGSMITLFENDMAAAHRILHVVEEIRKNSEETA